MRRTTMTAFGIGLALGGLALGATAAAQPGAVAEGTSAAVFVTDDSADGTQSEGQAEQRPDETPLTGADADAATAAAEAAVPDGTVLRVETDADGGGVYEAHMRLSDGTEAVVLMDENFTVTAVEQHQGRGGHRHGGPGHGDGSGRGDGDGSGRGSDDGSGRGSDDGSDSAEDGSTSASSFSA